MAITFHHQDICATITNFMKDGTTANIIQIYVLFFTTYGIKLTYML